MKEEDVNGHPSCRVCSMPHCTDRQRHSRTRDSVRDPNKLPAENRETVDGIDAGIRFANIEQRRVFEENDCWNSIGSIAHGTIKTAAALLLESSPSSSLPCWDGSRDQIEFSFHSDEKKFFKLKQIVDIAKGQCVLHLSKGDCDISEAQKELGECPANASRTFVPQGDSSTSHSFTKLSSSDWIRWMNSVTKDLEWQKQNKSLELISKPNQKAISTPDKSLNERRGWERSSSVSRNWNRPRQSRSHWLAQETQGASNKIRSEKKVVQQNAAWMRRLFSNERLPRRFPKKRQLE